jgi:hypothetical protein
LVTGSGHWSTHPEVSVVWAVDVPPWSIARHGSFEAYDAKGAVIKTTPLLF